MNFPSIFNDVLGPVMRGPSSSHSAAALRIGRLARDLMNGDIREVRVEYARSGSLATTHRSQGSEMGLAGGFLGWNLDDERLPDYRRAVSAAGIAMTTKIVDDPFPHPNMYRLTLKNGQETCTLSAISTGGGMIELVEIDGVRVSIPGDFYETLIYVRSPKPVLQFLETAMEYDEIILHDGEVPVVEIKAQNFPERKITEKLLTLAPDLSMKKLSPVVPVLSRKDIHVPFITCEEMLKDNKNRNLKLWELAVGYESERGNVQRKEVLEKMEILVEVFRNTIKHGLQGTEYADRILGCQSGNFREQMKNGALVQSDLLNQIILNVTAVMEVKSSMGVFVAAPTAGSCGVLPGAVFGMASVFNHSQEEIIKSLFAAGMIGIFIAAHATFAAEVGGCQAECGSASGMAAAALVTLAGGTLEQAIAAASMALQNSFGMVCDPIANRVEAPCLGKNVMAATNALSCANMALAGFDPLIPLDEVIETMDQVGKSLPHQLRCTALGGLSITKTSRLIEARLSRKGKIDVWPRNDDRTAGSTTEGH